MSLVVTNFATTTLATALLNPVDTTLVVDANTGNLFATLNPGDWTYIVMVDSLTSPTKREVLKVLARSNDTFTVQRGVDGTIAQTWVEGDYVICRWVRAMINDISTGGIDLGYANIVTYGGDPTGVEDTHPAWEAARAAGYRAVYFPKGNYKFLSGIVDEGDITIFGDGARISRIFISGPAGFDFLTWTGTYDQFSADQLFVRGVSIGTECASGAAEGTAISAQCTSPLTNWKQPVQGVILRDVAITNDVDLACWAKGIYLDTIESPEINDCFVSGFMTNGAGGSRAGIGIEIVSEFATNNNVKGTNPLVSNTIVYQCTTGVTINNSANNLKNYVEGGHLENVTALNCLTGIRVGSLVALSASGLPGWFIDNCHITAVDIGIDLATVAQFFIRGNLIYSIGGTDFIGVKITADENAGLETDGIIAHNTIMNVGSYSGFTRGINVECADATPAISSISIQGNRFGASGFTTAVYLGLFTSEVWVYPDNVIDTGGLYADFGSGNHFPVYETGDVSTAYVDLGTGTTFNCDWSVANWFRITPTADFSITFTNTPPVARAGTIVIEVVSADGFVLTLPAGGTWGALGPPEFSPNDDLVTVGMRNGGSDSKWMMAFPGSL